MTYLFFDTETTGIPNFHKEPSDASQPHICQLGAILTNKDGLVKGEINLLVKPDGWEIPAEASAIHGIYQEDAIKYGMSIKGVMSIFDRMLQMSEKVVAHNVKFDLFMTKIESTLCGIELHVPASPYCTMEKSKQEVALPATAKMIAAGFDGFKSPSLKEVYRHFFGFDFVGAHDAMADVRACKDVFFRLQQTKEIAA